MLSLAIEPGILARLANSIPQGYVLVSGTNGKTTTCAMLGAILEAAGFSTIRNRSGSNLARGLVSHLLQHANAFGGLKATESAVGVFEVDEAALIGLLPTLNPRAVVLTNLFRDQLDRYGEIDALSKGWARVLAGAGTDLQVVANADDPAVLLAASAAEPRMMAYGVETASGGASPDAWADSASCPVCSAALKYRSVNYSHLGDYVCPACGFAPPARAVEAVGVRAEGLNAATFGLRIANVECPVEIKLSGMFNVYNATAAAAGALVLGVDVEAIRKGIQAVAPVFGRGEVASLDGACLSLLLVKNPTGANEVLRLLRRVGEEIDLLVALNDQAADGEDVSWIWDVDVGGLPARRIVVAGERAEDLALRFKYGGSKPREPVLVERRLEKALEASLDGAKGTVYALATYTAMLQLRRELVRRGALTPYWER